MSVDSVTSKLIIAGSLCVSTGFLVPLSDMNPTGLMIPIYMISLGGLAAYTYIYSISIREDKDLRKNAAMLVAFFISVAFTVTTASTYGEVFDLTNPLVVIVFGAQAAMLTIVLTPDEIVGKTE